MVRAAETKTLAFDLPGQIRKGWFRRGVDIVVAMLVLTLTSPLLLLALFLIVLESPGNPFFIQRRLGIGGHMFDLLKLRTMIPDAEKYTGPVLAEKNDPRVTLVGRILRRTRIDELPQFFNVLRGEMAVVGPRPERPELYTKIVSRIPDFGSRLCIEPGITGLAQIRSDYHLDFRNKLRYDMLYVKKQRLLLDLRIMVATIWVVLAMKGSA